MEDYKSLLKQMDELQVQTREKLVKAVNDILKELDNSFTTPYDRETDPYESHTLMVFTKWGDREVLPTKVYKKNEIIQVDGFFVDTGDAIQGLHILHNNDNFYELVALGDEILKSKKPNDDKDTLYLVVLCGMYDCSEGDHTTYLCTSYEDARKRYEECVKDAEDAYRESFPYEKISDEEDDEWTTFRVVGESQTDIFIQRIKANNSMRTFVF